MDIQPKKSFLRKFWWLGLILIILIAGSVYGWISGHEATRLDNEKSAVGNESGELPDIKIVRPSSTPVLSLPFTLADKPGALIPMGETIFHADAADGHPGIDFTWVTPREIKLIASMDAAIVDIRIVPTTGATDVITKSDDGWGVDYCGLEAANPNLKIGDKVKTGDFIGWPKDEGLTTGKAGYKSTHWQFGYYDVTQKDVHLAGVEPRLCPMPYFDSASKSLIEQIWTDTNNLQMKANAPEICSGGYKDKFR